MKEITLSFTPDELRELAKQLYLGSYFLTTCDYDNQAMADDIMTRVCATGFAEAPETGGLQAWKVHRDGIHYQHGSG